MCLFYEFAFHFLYLLYHFNLFKFHDISVYLGFDVI